MRIHLLASLLLLSSLLVKAEEMFGLEPDRMGMRTQEEMERAVIPGSLDTADVPGELFYRSPDGRYAFSRPTAEQAEKMNYEVENHLVDMKTMKALTKDVHGVGEDFANRNHGGMRVMWRADSRAALFLGEAKWEPNAFCAVVIDDQGKARVLELTGPLYQALVEELKKQWPMICSKLELDESQVFEADSGPWSNEYVQYGAEFTPDGKSLRVKGLLETNAKGTEGHVESHATAEGMISLSDGMFKLSSVSVHDAGVAAYDENGKMVLKPKMVFPKRSRRSTDVPSAKSREILPAGMCPAMEGWWPCRRQ